MKKDKIIFFNHIQGLAETYPIIFAKDYKAKWIEELRKDYIKQTSSKSQDTRLLHMYRCPGIFDLLKEGFYMPIWHDLNITTDGDKKNFRWEIPSPWLQDQMEMPVLTVHAENTKFLPYPDYSLNVILKLNTPWHVIAPKNLKLLILPISYPDNYDYIANAGILDPSISNEINVQLFWNKLYGKTTIKAGTPICQIIPLSEKKYELICRYKNAHDDLWEKKKKFIQNCTFWFNRKNIIQLYNKHFHGN